MPHYWFTTHWPSFKGGRDTLHIYIQEKYQHKVSGIGPGDRVLIYEFKSGPALLKENGEIIRRRKGAGAVICEAEVVTRLRLRDWSEIREHYADGREANWAWIAETSGRTYGRLPRERVNELLGFEPGYYFYGFNHGRGIMQLDADDYDRLAQAFSKTVDG